jgi:hypothetical protein
MAAPKAPDGLRSGGKSLWASIAGKYQLRPDELSVLTSACKTADRIESLERSHDELGNPVLTRGSMGQDVIHPLIAEMRTQHAHMATLLAKLKLPDDADGEPVNQQRDAANSKWATGQGRGA